LMVDLSSAQGARAPVPEQFSLLSGTVRSRACPAHLWNPGGFPPSRVGVRPAPLRERQFWDGLM